uniref:hypothetical protein n=1 Tax=Mariniphaga sp. TaxID=1954475 RepID=UPI0035616D66
EDFTELVPTDKSVCLVYANCLQKISEIQHKATHEDIYYLLDDEHYKIFGKSLRWKSYDSFRHFFNQNIKYFYRNP